MGHSTVRAPRLKDAAERPLGGGEGQHDPVPPTAAAAPLSSATPSARSHHPLCEAARPFRVLMGAAG